MQLRKTSSAALNRRKLNLNIETKLQIIQLKTVAKNKNIPRKLRNKKETRTDLDMAKRVYDYEEG